MKRLIPLVLCLWAWGAVITACRSPRLPEPTKEQRQAGAEALYTKQLVACTEFVNPNEMRKCIAETNDRWGRLEDGGRK